MQLISHIDLLNLHKHYYTTKSFTEIVNIYKNFLIYLIVNGYEVYYLNFLCVMNIKFLIFRMTEFTEWTSLPATRVRAANKIEPKSVNAA